MSWSAYYIGTPENIIAALKKQSDDMGPSKSKEELDAAIPHIAGLLKENYKKPEQPQPVLRLSASGSGYDGTQGCFCNIENLGSVLV